MMRAGEAVMHLNADSDIQLIQNFLMENMSQLTVAGLCMLQDILKEGELAVFFRNNHFGTLLMHEGALYTLVTDQGYQLESGVVWEKMDNVEGDTTYYSSEFVTYRDHVARREAETAQYLERLAMIEEVCYCHMCFLAGLPVGVNPGGHYMLALSSRYGQKNAIEPAYRIAAYYSMSTTQK